MSERSELFFPKGKHPHAAWLLHRISRLGGSELWPPLPPLRSPTLHRVLLQRRIHKLPEPLALLRILNGGFPLALIGIHQIRHMLLQLLANEIGRAHV